MMVTCWAPPNANTGPWPWLGGSSTGTLDTAHYADMATAFTTYCSNALAAGVYVTHVSPANEPDFTPSGYAQTAWTTAQLVNFVKNNLGPALATWGAANPSWQKATGLAAPLIVVGETENWGNLSTWVAAFEADATALSYVALYASHQYVTCSAPPSPCSRPIWETEVSGQGADDSSMTDAMVWVGKVYTAITTGGVSAWLWWWARDVTDNDNSRLTGTPATNAGDQTLSVADWNNLEASPPKRAFALGHFARFVRAGDSLLDLSSSPSGVNSLAFLRLDGSLVVVCVNTNGTSTSLSMDLSAFGHTVVRPWLTDASNSLAQQADIVSPSKVFGVTLGANSVTTFLGVLPPAPLTPPLTLSGTNF